MKLMNKNGNLCVSYIYNAPGPAQSAEGLNHAELKGRKGISGSMTVEAAFVLPFFLFAILNLIWIVEIYRFQGNMSMAMHSVAKELAVYAYEYDYLTSAGNDEHEHENKYENPGLLPALTGIYAADRVNRALGNSYISSSPVKGGSGSINWMGTKLMQEDDCIDLVAYYNVEPAVKLMGFDGFLMYSRMRTRAWTGYKNDSSGNAEGHEEDEIVYITPEGSVYHRSRACTHLTVSISALDKSSLDKARSADGSKYYPCESCSSMSEGGTVFVTQYGNRYHSTMGCNKLMRTVIAVPLKEASGRSACSKCGL